MLFPQQDHSTTIKSSLICVCGLICGAVIPPSGKLCVGILSETVFSGPDFAGFVLVLLFNWIVICILLTEEFLHKCGVSFILGST